jgi:hypothetical protein
MQLNLHVESPLVAAMVFHCVSTPPIMIPAVTSDMEKLVELCEDLRAAVLLLLGFCKNHSFSVESALFIQREMQSLLIQTFVNRHFGL